MMERMTMNRRDGVSSVFRTFSASAICGICLFWSAAASTDQLQSYNVDPTQISVSGISSGGYMAQQFHVAFSKAVMGAGIIAGGPYYCAQGNVNTALTQCMFTYGSRVQQSVDATLQAFQQGKIDDPSALQDDKVYLFSGSRDQKVVTAVMDALESYYKDPRIGVKAENIKYVKGLPAGHAQIIDRYQGTCANNRCNRCDTSTSPFINDCKTEFAHQGQELEADTAGRLLAHFYGIPDPNSPSEKRLPGGRTTATSKPISFDQTKFTGGTPDKIGMMPTGYIYVPKNCETGASCKLHVALHGCQQNSEFIPENGATQYVLHAGYNEWAEKNDIIVLYPQAAKILNPTDMQHSNPKACWDWWGYTDPNYHTKSGKQMAAVKAMVDRVAKPNGEPVVICKNPVVSGNSVTLKCEASGAHPITSYHVVVSGPSPKNETLPDGDGFSKQYANLADGQYTAEVTATDDQDQDSVPDIKPFSIPSDKVCFTETNGTHVTAGRAHRCGFFNLFYCANGSNDALGFFQGTTTSLQQTAPGNWTKVPGC
jgi:poly(3-hydroxybutyrate) depolymerase